MVELSLLGHNPDVQAWSGLHTNESLEGISISLSDVARISSSGEGHVEGVLSVVLPDSHEVWFVWEGSLGLVWEDHVLLLDELWGQLGKSVPLSLEGLTTLWGGGVNTEVKVTN